MCIDTTVVLQIRGLKWIMNADQNAEAQFFFFRTYPEVMSHLPGNSHGQDGHENPTSNPISHSPVHETCYEWMKLVSDDAFLIYLNQIQ